MPGCGAVRTRASPGRGRSGWSARSGTPERGAEPTLHALLPVVDLGQIRVVRAAHQGQVLRDRAARRRQTDAGDGTPGGLAPGSASPARPRRYSGRRLFRRRRDGRPRGRMRLGRRVVFPRLFRGAGVCAKRRASRRAIFSVRASSMRVARSPSGMEDRIRVLRRPIFRHSSALAVNWTLYRAGARGWIGGGARSGSGASRGGATGTGGMGRAQSCLVGGATPSTPSGRSWTGCGSFFTRVRASGLGASSAASSSISRLDLWDARFRTESRFSAFRCGASFAIPLRCKRPSASISSNIGCSREARATAIRNRPPPPRGAAGRCNRRTSTA